MFRVALRVLVSSCMSKKASLAIKETIQDISCLPGRCREGTAHSTTRRGGIGWPNYFDGGQVHTDQSKAFFSLIRHIKWLYMKLVPAKTLITDYLRNLLYTESRIRPLRYINKKKEKETYLRLEIIGPLFIEERRGSPVRWPHNLSQPIFNHEYITLTEELYFLTYNSISCSIFLRIRLPTFSLTIIPMVTKKTYWVGLMQHSFLCLIKSLQIVVCTCIHYTTRTCMCVNFCLWNNYAFSLCSYVVI